MLLFLLLLCPQRCPLQGSHRSNAIQMFLHSWTLRGEIFVPALLKGNLKIPQLSDCIERHTHPFYLTFSPSSHSSKIKLFCDSQHQLLLFLWETLNRWILPLALDRKTKTKNKTPFPPMLMPNYKTGDFLKATEFPQRHTPYLEQYLKSKSQGPTL